VRVRWSLLALQRVSEIVEYISRDRPETAREWVVAIFDTVRQLERFPGRGRVVPEVGRASIRELLHGEYRIIYKVEAKTIGILTVRHGRRRFDPNDIRGRR